MRYLAEQPKPVLTLRGLQHLASYVVRTTFFHIAYPMLPFEPLPESPNPVSEADPTAKFSGEHLPLCQAMYDAALSRLERLESKAETLFTVHAVVMPASVSTLVFAAGQSKLDYWIKSPLVAGATVAVLFAAISFLACLRALQVRNIQLLHLPAVVDVEAGCVRTYDGDRHARGLLWCALANDATGDHVANFVRSATTTLAIAAALALSCAGVTYVMSG